MHLWSMDFGDNEFQYAYSVAADDSNNVFVAGSFYGAVTFGGVRRGSAGSTDIFIAKFSAGGDCLWSKKFGNTKRQSANRIAADRFGNIIISGSFEGDIDFGGGALTSLGGFDLFVAKFDAEGNHLWSRSYGDADQSAYEDIKGIAVTDSGKVVIAGLFAGSVDFGGGALVSSSGLDIFVAKFDENSGHLWSRHIEAPGNQYAQGVAVDGLDNVITAGYFEGQVDFGGGSLVNASGSDMFIAKFDPEGNHMWSSRYGNSNPGDYHRAQGVAVDGLNNIVVAGDYEGDIDFGGGVLASAGDYDVFVAKFDANGGHIWSRRFGNASEDYAEGIAADDSAHVVIIGYFYGDIDFGGGLITSLGGNDLFVAKFDADGGHSWSQGFGDSQSLPYRMTAYQFAGGVATDGAGSIIITGFFYGTVDFGGGMLTSGVGANSLSNTDAFAAKFGAPGSSFP